MGQICSLCGVDHSQCAPLPDEEPSIFIEDLRCTEPGCTELMAKGRNGYYKIHFKNATETKPCPKSSKKIT